MNVTSTGDSGPEDMGLGKPFKYERKKISYGPFARPRLEETPHTQTMSVELGTADRQLRVLVWTFGVKIWQRAAVLSPLLPRISLPSFASL